MLHWTIIMKLMAFSLSSLCRNAGPLMNEATCSDHSCFRNMLSPGDKNKLQLIVSPVWALTVTTSDAKDYQISIFLPSAGCPPRIMSLITLPVLFTWIVCVSQRGALLAAFLWLQGPIVGSDYSTLC